MRADAAVDRGNTLASWAELAAPAEAAKLLASAVASYSEALRQEEDAVVRSKLSRKLPSKLPAYLSQCRDLLLLPGAGYWADPGAGYWADPGAVFNPQQRVQCSARFAQHPHVCSWSALHPTSRASTAQPQKFASVFSPNSDVQRQAMLCWPTWLPWCCRRLSKRSAASGGSTHAEAPLPNR